MTEILVDSNILIYSIQKDAGKKHEIAYSEISQLTEAKNMAVSVQNLVEFSRVALEKASPPVPAESVSEYVSNFSKFARILYYSEKTVDQAVFISNQYKIHFFDALLGATMQENHISEILTENTADFVKIPWIRARNPFA